MNNREENRVDLSGLVSVLIEDTKKNFQGELLNINSRAMAFLTKDHLKLDANHFFSVILPYHTKPLKNIKGHIIRQEKMGDQYLTVLAFTSIPKTEMLIILNYIEETCLKNLKS